VATAGPLIGSIGAVAVYLAGRQLDSNLMLAIAYAGLFLNLINLTSAGACSPDGAVPACLPQKTGAAVRRPRSIDCTRPLGYAAMTATIRCVRGSTMRISSPTWMYS
jgi:hypothetical protein